MEAVPPQGGVGLSQRSRRPGRAARWRRLAAELAATVAAGGLALAASIAALSTPFDECDNIAGTCIHLRQQLAIVAIDVACLVAVALALGAVACLAWRGRMPRWLLVLVLGGGGLAVAVLALHPVAHLDNSRTSWLGGG